MSASPTHTVGQSATSTHAVPADQVYLIIPSDDGGMSQSVNMALEKLIATGLPVSVSVMFPTPWYQETVDTKEYGLGMMGFFGDTGQNPQYEAAPGNKTDSVVAYVNRLRPGSTYSSPTLGSTMRGWRRMTTFTSSRFAS